MYRIINRIVSAGLALLLAAEAAAVPVSAESRQPIGIIEFGNVSTALTVGKVPDYTTYLTGDALLHASILNEGWGCVTDMNIHTSKNEGNPVPDDPVGVPYSYLIALRADSGYFFTEGFDLYYNGEAIDSSMYTATLQDDSETLMLLCDFIPQVTPLAPDAQTLSEIYILDAALDFAAGDAPRFTAHPADPSLVTVQYERWVDLLDYQHFVMSDEAYNQAMELTEENRLTAFAANGQYHYDICVTANYGYVFADDVKLFVNGIPCTVNGHTPDTIAVNEVCILTVPQKQTATTVTTVTTMQTTSAAKQTTSATTRPTTVTTMPTTHSTTVTTKTTESKTTASAAKTTTSAKPPTTKASTTTAKQTTTEYTVPTAAFDPDLRYGDLNQDGRISVSDIVLLLRYLAENDSLNLSAAGLAAADINLDGLLDMQDEKLLVKLVQENQDKQPVLPPKKADFGSETDPETPNLPDTAGKEWIFKPEGKSAAYTEEPIAGLTVSAPENALSYDGQLLFSELENKEAKKLDQACTEAGAIMLDAWHVDAGIEPDEHLPGCYSCSYDLSRLSLPEEMNDQLHVLRIADDGTVSEYPIETDGTNLTWMSDQNSITLIAVCRDAVIIAVALGAIVTAVEYAAWINSADGCAGTYDTKRCTIYYHDNEPQETKDARKKRLNEIESDADRQAREYAEEKVGDAWGGIAGLFMNYAREVNRITAQKKNELLRDNSEYQSLMELENGHPADVVLLARQYDIAMDYLYLHEGCPKLKKPDIVFSEAVDDLGDAVTNYVVGNYMLVRRTPQKDNDHIPKYKEYFDLYGTAVPADVSDRLLTTMTHELFHLIQATKLAGKYEAHVKFFEMTALTVECHCAEKYKEWGYIRNHVLDDGQGYDTFGYPLDETSAKLTNANHYLQTQAGYSLARFLLHIESIQKKKYRGWDMIQAYKKFGTISGMFSHICGFADATVASGKPDEILNVYWKHFQKQKDIESIMLLCAETDYPMKEDTKFNFPSQIKKHQLKEDEPALLSKVPAKNLACTAVAVEGAQDRAWSALLSPDPKFAEQQPEHEFLIPPAGAKQKGQDSRYGTVLTASGRMLYYRELQCSGSVGASSYTIYYIPAPDTPKVELDRDKETLTVKLQTAPSKVSQMEKTDRFLIICNIDGRDEYTVPVEFDKWTKDVVIPFSLLPLHLDTKNTLRLTVCELIDKDGETAECRLAESKPFEADLGEADLEKTMYCNGKFGDVGVHSEASFSMQMNGSFRFVFKPYYHETKEDEPDTDYQPPADGEGTHNPFDGGEVNIKHTIGHGKSDYSGFTVTGSIENDDDPHNWTAEIASCSPDSFHAYYSSIIEQLDVDIEQEWKGSGMQSGTVQLTTDEKGDMHITVSIITAEGKVEVTGKFR